MGKLVQNEKNKTNIEYINIFGLFERYDVEIPFDNVANIFIGENGMGKTTILNSIYYLLEKKFDKLAEMNISSIEIKFNNDPNSHKVSIYDLIKYNQKMMPRRRRHIDDEMLSQMLDDMLKNLEMNRDFMDNYLFEQEIDLMARKVSRMLGMPISIARRNVYDYVKTRKFFTEEEKMQGNFTKVKKLVTSLNENITQKILYLPTYRRIEDGYSKLNISDENTSDENTRESDILIRFGMSDVQKVKKRILDNIKREAIDGFNKMTGVLLTQYTCGTKMERSSNIDKEWDIKTVQLILDRSGNEIDDSSKDEIINLIKNGKIKNGEYSLLTDLIQKLIISYNSQKKYDDRIKRFTETCNKYLNGKKFYYNPSELTLEVYITSDGEITEKILELEYLSSGEKQIVSLFSKLYLENDKESIVIIDEPELSLSLKWQSLLLPDIIRSENCELLLTVTHSPFIFDNEFDMDALEMRKFIKNAEGK